MMMIAERVEIQTMLELCLR